MPKIEVEIGEDGKVGTLPEELQKFFDSRINEAFGKGKSKAAEDAKSQIESEVKKAKEQAIAEFKREHGDRMSEAEREKLTTLEAELSKAKEAEAEREKNYAEAQRIRDERHQKALKEQDDKHAKAQAEIERRTGRIRELATKEIRVEALQAGAREASLEELELLLSRRIGLDPETLQPFVADATDPTKPALDADEKPVTIEGLVTQYLADHPHHKATAPGKPGGARGGQSLAGGRKLTADEAEREAAFKDLAENPGVSTGAKVISTIRKRLAS